MNKKLAMSQLIIVAAAILTALVFLPRSYVPTSAVPSKEKCIVIDAGHGTPDEGASSKDGIYESEINLKIAKKLKKLLEKAEIKVIMTRTKSTSLSESKTNNKKDDLSRRVEIRDTSNADIFISIHLNHFTESQYRGAQVFYGDSVPKSKVLAGFLQESLIKLVDPDNKREIKSNNEIYVLKSSKIPCVLVECGFLSNPQEANLLSQDEYQQKIAYALYNGVCKFFINEQTD